ncbi:MAG: SAM-dependent DNA methyltransferase [Proteobacteria bacterium]|nr:SAM-dependent DNA methyltransferase [Pseudomonadota bacterium]
MRPGWLSPTPLTPSQGISVLANSADVEARGAIFTRTEVVDFILDLIGYEVAEPLCERSLLEPSFGGGNFLLPVVQRLLASCRRATEQGLVVPPLDDCIRAVEVHADSFAATAAVVIGALVDGGIAPEEAARLCRLWLVRGDFLLTEFSEAFDYVLGNPPYVRQELVLAPLLREYRRRYKTLFDRADLYIPFYERSLQLLKPGGKLCFICSDRWTKNRYGGPLRALIAHAYHLRAYVDMFGARAFQSDVIAYPAITLIARERPGVTVVAHHPEIEAGYLGHLAAALRGEVGTQPDSVYCVASVGPGPEPWLLQGARNTGLIRRIERSFPLIEDAGCKVGIGVATGADKAFIGKFEELDVEPDRKLPLVMTRDIGSGQVQWRGYGVINPFTDEGPLVDLARYPRLAAHVERHRAAISGRYIAQRDATWWYRTIDRIRPSLARQPKLLIPDIKGEAQVVYEGGELYPHHNLYYVVSDDWDLHALQAVLLSKLAHLFIATYSTRMHGGCLRFQAQYLRRLRLPRWVDVPGYLRTTLKQAAMRRDLAACDGAMEALYGLSHDERATLAALEVHAGRPGSIPGIGAKAG